MTTSSLGITDNVDLITKEFYMALKAEKLVSPGVEVNRIGDNIFFIHISCVNPSGIKDSEKYLDLMSACNFTSSHDVTHTANQMAALLHSRMCRFH